MKDAVDATATMCSTDAGIDVEEQLRVQFRERGIAAPDQHRIDQLARNIRSGRAVTTGHLNGSIDGQPR